MTTESQSILVLHNPRSGASDRRTILDQHVQGLENHGFHVECLDSLSRFEERAKELHSARQLRAAISAGGDGTATAVASRLPADVPIWICPLGTENLLAKYLGMTTQVEQACQAIVRLKTHHIDAGLANGKLFLVMASVGFDAEVVRFVHSERRGHIRKWHYWWGIFRALFRYSFPKLQVAIQSQREDGETAVGVSTNSFEKISPVAWFFCMNIPRYADRLSIAPMAVEDDGYLDLCTFSQGGWLQGLRYLRLIRRERHRRDADFASYQVLAATIQADAEVQNVPYQLDGDFGGYLPLTIECLPRRFCYVKA
jgi:diacylglycerol kinase (ATP)